MSIKLSPKYGLNPTIPLCFWCGKEKNEIALMGRMSKKKTTRTAWGTDTTTVEESDIEAPRNAILDYEPCDACKEHMSRGITLLATSTTPVLENMPPVGKDEHGNPVYPHPWYIVITEDATRRLFTPDAAENIIAHRKGYVPIELLQHLTRNAEPEGDDEND